MLLSVYRLRSGDLDLHLGLPTLHRSLCWTVEVLLCGMHVLTVTSWASEIDVLL